MRFILSLMIAFTALPALAQAQSVYVSPVERQEQMDQLKQNFQARQGTPQQPSPNPANVNERLRTLAREGLQQRKSQMLGEGNVVGQ